MTILLCILSFIAGIEVRKPCINFCMRAVMRAQKRMYKHMLENNRLRKKMKEYDAHR